MLLSFLVLIVIITIVHQIYIVTGTDARVTRNDNTLVKMDLAIESAMLQVFEQLAEDGQTAGGSEEGGDMLGDGGADPEAPGEEGESVDSMMDEWARPQSTTINEINLRILIQDEDSKYNILNMLGEDEDQAQAAFDRVVRVLEACRLGTVDVIDSGTALEMATTMRDHMLERSDSFLPRPTLLSDDEENEDLGMPLSLKEFACLEPFEEYHFRDYFDVDGARVHSIGSFLTVWTGVATGEDGSAAGGFGVNVNTAPMAVLVSLMDDRDVQTRVWDDVREYRNLEEDPPDDGVEIEPMLDEYGNEMFARKFFDNLEELEEVYGWDDLEQAVKADVEALLGVQSNVFSIFITARLDTIQESRQVVTFESRREQEEYERSGTHIVRTIRAVVWRRSIDEEMETVPIIRWEVLEYAPLEVLDYPEDDY